MKRVKLTQNKFITLTQINTNAGKTQSFEIARSVMNYQPPVLATFLPSDKPRALRAFDLLSQAMHAHGPQLRHSLVQRILIGQGSTRLQPEDRRDRPKRDMSSKS
ncbi:MAG TPA: hypothetical protein VFO40_15610 [Chthoniobacterales bacterium]|nr:hypothetical protein [Chthoniobacterales bacterium]